MGGRSSLHARLQAGRGIAPSSRCANIRHAAVRKAGETRSFRLHGEIAARAKLRQCKSSYDRGAFLSLWLWASRSSQPMGADPTLQHARASLTTTSECVGLEHTPSLVGNDGSLETLPASSSPCRLASERPVVGEASIRQCWSWLSRHVSARRSPPSPALSDPWVPASSRVQPGLVNGPFVSLVDHNARRSMGDGCSVTTH